MPNNNNNNNIKIPWIKVTIVFALLFLCFLLQVTVWSLEVYIADVKIRKDKKRLKSTKNKDLNNDAEVDIDYDDDDEYTLDNENDDVTKRSRRKLGATVRPSRPMMETELHSYKLQKEGSYNSINQRTADAYWNQVLSSGILDWDYTIQNDYNNENDDAKTLYQRRLNADDRYNNDDDTSIDGLYALQKAAEYGHPIAQFHIANAYASGFWTFGDNDNYNNSNNDNSTEKLLVADSWELDDNNNIILNQHNRALLLYHMAAIGGNVEAAMAMASQYNNANKQTMITNPNIRDKVCMKSLPYYASAAHTIIDKLMINPESRGYILPVKDKHILYKIHLHGGDKSKLDNDNRPDENSETLQFYSLRAYDTTEDTTSASAAYTLARYYHTGLRGATQNLTLALQYYELASQKGHWEASGQAGMLYLWGISSKDNIREPNPIQAHKLFNMGAKPGLDGCLQRYQTKLKATKKSDQQTFLCDDVSLNGLGLLHLLGVPTIIPVNRELAQEYFTLARDQGNPDAMYNLAMMKLGWNTHYKDMSSLKSDGQTSATITDPLHHVVSGKDAVATNSPTAAEYQQILTDLATAAGKSHILARHRLAILYENGIKIPTSTSSIRSFHIAVRKDCSKASQHYKWIIDQVIIPPRLRKAYKQYMAGETSNALRNYLTAAAMGNDLGQLNAAFIMEQGECIGLKNTDCSKAAVRLWKAAAAKGNAEASMRVGDFYYYGRFRDNMSATQVPFGWLQHIIYPEEHLLPRIWATIKLFLIRNNIYEPIRSIFGLPKETTSESIIQQPADDDDNNEEQATCEASSNDGTCPVSQLEQQQQQQQHTLHDDLAMAAHYYRQAADRNQSPRAHFNLGFMYQWGLGLKQDFPLAKRQYDLAISTSGMTQEADVPVTIALFVLSSHEYFVKKMMSWEAYWNDNDDSKTDSSSSTDENDDDGESIPSPLEGKEVGRPVPSNNNRLEGKTKRDVILAHIFSWESLLILILTLILSKLMMLHHTRR